MTPHRRWLGSALIIAALWCALPMPTRAADPDHRFRPGEVILKFRSGVGEKDAEAILSDLGATDVKYFTRIRAERARITHASVEEAIRRYKNHPQVEFIEPNFIYHVEETPNDPQFGKLWGLLNLGQTGGTPGADIHAPPAWDIATVSEDVRVAMIDTGIDYGHPDLAANVWTNPGEIPGNGMDDDGNGFVDDVHGWDFSNHDSDPMDDNGHGTHTAGTVGAVGNNALGVTGVAWRVKLMAVKFLDAGGSGSLEDAIDAIQYATLMGAQVMSNSWGGGGYSEALRQAIADANDAGILFTAAAGNNYQNNNDINPHYPSSYDLPNIVAVAATDANDQLAYFSNYGPTSVDLGAPGVQILSTLPGASYGYLSGTSMATPHVTGVLALMFGRYPGISAPEAKASLLAAADPVPGLTGLVLTGGRLDAFLALAVADSIAPDRITDLRATSPDGDLMKLLWTATGDDGRSGTASRYDVRYSTSPITEASFAESPRATDAPRPRAAGSPEQMTVRGLSFSTRYYFALKATDERGNSSPLSNLTAGTTLGPPDVSVLPASMSASLYTGGTAKRTLKITNGGVGELLYKVAFAPQGGLPVTRGPRIAESRAGNARAREFPVLAMAREPYGKGAVPRRALIAPEPAVQSGRLPPCGGTRILILQSSGDVSEIRDLLRAFPDVSAVDVLDGNAAVPTSSQLAAYQSVIVVEASPFANPVELGNVLADYADQGGGVVLTLASFIAGYQIGGRFLSGGYFPFDLGFGPAGSSSLGTFDGSHPIMAGVNSAYGDLLGEVGLAPGAQDVARWSNGYPFVATQGGNVAAVNIFVGYPGFWTGDVPLILHNAALWTGSAVNWMSLGQDSGVVPAGTTAIVDVAFDAAGLSGGDYDGSIVVSSNDPDELEVRSAAHLHVTGAADIAVSDSASDFGEVYIGTTRRDTLVVSNCGAGTLVVQGVTLTGAGFSAPAGGFSLGQGESRILLVSYQPTTVGASVGTLTIASDDPDEGQFRIPLRGSGVFPPELSVAPDSVSADLFTGQSASRTVTLHNGGGSDLVFEIDVESAGLDFVPAGLGATPVIASGKAFPLERLAARKGFPAALEAAPAGETDKGTRFTSRAPAAPPSKRVAGEEVFGSTQNSFFFGPRTRGNIFRCTKNRSLREHRLYLHVIRPTQLWFLVYEGMQQYGTYNLVSASNVSPAVSGEGWYSSGPLNLQLVAGRYYMVCASFEEVCEYFNELEISPYPIPASFGELIAGAGWNWAPTAHFPPDPSQAVPSDAFGDAAAYYQTLVTGPGIGWVEVQPRSGRTAPGVDATLAVRLDAGGLFGGDYRANLLVRSNDPDEPEHRLPVHLRVTGVPNIVLSRTAFDFGKVFIGTERSDTLIVKNFGTDQLVVKGLATDIPDFIFDSSPFTVAPGESLVRTVTFRPTQAVARSGTLTVTSNDPDQGVLSLGLHGEGLVPPGIEVTPDSLALTLLSGQSATRTLTLRNPGGSDLIWDIGSTFPSGASLANARVESRSPVFSSPRRTAVKVEGAGLTSPSTQARGSLGRPSRPPESEIFRSAPAAPQPLVTSPGAPLEDLLQHLDQNHDAVSVLIPDRYDFQEGENGTFILDGGDDMYDLGNLLFTNLGGPLEYSAGQIQTAPTLGVGKYFTVKYPGLFVLAADLEGVTDFTITGNLGADGEGSVDGAVLVTEVAGTTYRGFVKRVYNAGDPSVNHLVIVADGPGLAHEFSLSTDSDFHNVSGLSQTRRLYYVLYAGAGGSYIGDGPTLEIMNAFLQALDLAPRWLSATPGSGTVPAGGSAGISVRFDATGLLGGDHAADLVIRHNVPGQPPLRVPTLLHAIGVPELQVSAGTLSFGQVFAGGSRTDTLVVSNVGTDTLRVSGLGVDRAEFTLDPSGFSLAPGASRPVTVTFSSASIGVFDGRLTIQSDDPDDPEVSVALHAEAVAPPHVTLSPASLTASLATGERTTQFLQLGNTGGSDLVFQVDLDAGAAAAAAAGPEAAPAPSPVTRVEPAPSRARGARGPDGRDQRPPHGPSGLEERLARQLAALSSQARVYFDDMERGANGWTTQAYGEDDLWHQTHTSFSSPSTSWWCALEPKGSYDTGRRIQTAAVSPTIDLGGRGAPITLQFFESYNTEQGWDFCMVDVSADGGSSWESLRGGLGSAPSGSSGGWITTSLDLSRYAGRAIRIRFYFDTIDAINNAFPGWFFDDVLVTAVGVPWLTLHPLAGTVTPGSSQSLAVDFVTTQTPVGDYDAGIVVTSNDPGTPRARVPVHLHLSGRPRIAVAPGELSFGTVFLGFTRRDSLTVSNPGTDLLVVSEVSTDSAEFAVQPKSFDLPSGQQRPVYVDFHPGRGGSSSATLKLASNDPGQPLVTVALSGIGVAPPDIEVSPGDFRETLVPGTPGQTANRTLTIRNTGGSGLSWSLTPLFGTGPSVVASSPQISSEHPAGIKPEGPAGGASPAPPRSVYVFPGAPERQGADAAALPRHPVPADTPLEAILENLDKRYLQVTDAIPDRFDFTDGETGILIPDGGNDMYDLGNYLSTSLGAFISYSDGAIAQSPLFGSGGFYFTRKYPGLFLLAADMSGVTSFTISGNLGADGWGSVDGAVLQTEVSGVGYRGYVKRVHSAMDPSVNHLVIVAEDPGVNHEFSPNTEEDYHRVFGLGEINRIYYLLYASADGGYVDDTQTLDIMNAFLGSIGLGPPWLTVAPRSGTIPAGASADVTLHLDATGLQLGDYMASLRISSSDPDEPQVLVPVTLTAIAPSGVEDGDLPTARALLPSRPNPFRSSTRIDFDLPAAARVTLRIHDAGGRTVRDLVDGLLPPGRHRIEWDGRDAAGRPVPPGLYFYTFRSGGYVATRRMVLLR